MKLPRFVLLLGYAGLIPFLAGPLWLTMVPQTAPLWLDHVWSAYIMLVAGFLAGTFWGFALMAAEGPDGRLGIFMASALLLLTWISMWLPFRLSLYGLALVFLLLLLADFWRERTLDTIPGYFQLRTTLTVGVLTAIAWRLLLFAAPSD
jgi:hypothetical protein